MSAAEPRAAFVIPHPYVDALACFREPIAALAREGWRVDLYTTLTPDHPAPFFAGARVRIVPIAMTRAGVVRMVAALTTARPKYRWIVTVPQWGLHYAGRAAALAGIPMACISDEIFAASEAASGVARAWKARERRAHQHCRWTIALSEERAAFVRDDNRLGAAHQIFVVPNAAPGPASRAVSHYYQDILGLAPQQRVLLHAGSLWWEPARRLAQVASAWRGDWVVVFQNRFAQAHDLRPSPAVRFATGVLPSPMLDYAVSSACVGLALYDDRRVNDRLMGTASGKVALYLRNALPVIACGGESLAWVEREGCGVHVSSVDQVRDAADRICADYGRFASAAVRVYAERLDFTPRFRPVIERMAAA